MDLPPDKAERQNPAALWPDLVVHDHGCLDPAVGDREGRGGGGRFFFFFKMRVNLDRPYNQTVHNQLGSCNLYET